MLDRAFQRSVYFRLWQLAFIEDEGFHVFYQKLLMFRVNRAETEMIDKLILLG